MELDEIRAIIIELLAAESGEDPDALLAELKAAGQELPCDSVLAAEALSKVEERCGVRLQMTYRTAAAMRSVQAYAEAIAAELRAAEAADESADQDGTASMSASNTGEPQ